MKIKKAFVSSAILFSSLFVGAAALDMPKEIEGVSVGMPVEDLLKARPKIKQKGLEQAKMKSAKLMLMENLAPGGDFFAATYGIQDGKVFTIALMGNSPSGKERALRRKVVKDCVKRWGKQFSKRVPEDGSRPGKAQPTMTWEADDVEVALSLPRTRERGEKRPYYLTLHFRPVTAVRSHPWKDLEMGDADKKAFFKEHDIDE